jgi:N-acetylglucosamine-6-sulfatase
VAEEARQENKNRPNIVFVLIDDALLGVQNPVMPGLQNNVISQGVKFANTVSTYPLCGPGRATIQRGQYSHNTRIFGNSLPIGGWEKFQQQGMHRSTFATWINARGYATGLFGKYLNNYQDRLIPPGWDRWYAWDGQKQGWQSVNDQGVHKDLDPPQADALVADNALRFINTRLANDSAFLAFVNFGAMHRPFYHADIDADKFAGERVPRTLAFNEEDVSDKPSNIRGLPRLSDAEVRQMDVDYRNGLRSLGRVDRFIRDASDLLRQHGEFNNTFFVFYTDNGNHFGQHRLPHGKLQPYEEDINFPLIFSGPGIPGGVVRRELVGNHDIAPTLAAMAGATVPDFVDGRNVLPLARGTVPEGRWPRTAILSMTQPGGEGANPKWALLRMPNKKYVRHAGGEEEYYDLGLDPFEVRSAHGSVEPEVVGHYNARIDELLGCAGASCRQAENGPALPPPAP